MKNRIVLKIVGMARRYRVNQKYKDRVFRMIFHKKKDLLSLYNAVNGTDYTNPDDLEIRTLDDAVYLGYKNDLSFLISDTLNLYEHQSTVNPNMPLRGLLYFTNMLKAYVEEKKCNIYGSKLVQLPVPRYLVFYNGSDSMPDVSVLSLSDAYMRTADVSAGKGDMDGPIQEAIKAADPALECKAVILNINKGHNIELMAKCERLEAYAFFVSRVRAYLAAGCTLEAAVDRAIDDCVTNDKLTDILVKNRAEVKNMFLTDFSEKKYRKILVEEAIAEGREAGRLLTIRIFREAKENPEITFEQIAEKVGCTVQEVEDTLKMIGIDRVSGMERLCIQRSIKQRPERE